MLEERGIVPGGTTAHVSETSEEHNGNDEPDESDSDKTEERDVDQDDSEPSSSEGTVHVQSSRRSEDVSPTEISDAIVRALKKCPNQSCTLHSLTRRVLKEVSVLTSGKPRTKFEKRVIRMVNSLDDENMVEKYRAKNQRVRLLKSSYQEDLPLGPADANLAP